MYKKKVAIIGESGDLASNLYTRLQSEYEVSAFGKDDYNFLDKECIIKLANKIHKHDVIICCSGVFDNVDSWDMYIINTVAPAFLIEQLSLHKSTSHFIMIGSRSAKWTSWPGATITRVSYNNSKKSIQQYIESVEHSNSLLLKLTMFNPIKFKSKMSNYEGIDISEVVDVIMYIISNKNIVSVYDI